MWCSGRSPARRERHCSSKRVLSSVGGPGRRMRVRGPFAVFVVRIWPGAVPAELGSMVAVARMSACLRLLGVIARSRAAKRSSILRRTEASGWSVSWRTSATASRVRSSSVGPRPPEKKTRSERRRAVRVASTSCGRLSPTMVLKATGTPRALRRSVRKRELVSWRKGVRSSEPTAMISAIMGFGLDASGWGWDPSPLRPGVCFPGFGHLREGWERHILIRGNLDVHSSIR